MVMGTVLFQAVEISWLYKTSIYRSNLDPESEEYKALRSEVSI